MIQIVQIPKKWMIFCCVSLVLLLGVLDTLSGKDISFSVFYMLPIYLVTWSAGRLPGVAISLFSALTWLAADYLAGGTPSNHLIPIWNMLVRLAFFLLMTYLLSELLIVQQRRRTLERIFFHDILNLVGSLRGFAELLKDRHVPASQDVFDLIYHAADRSIEDIEAQRTLANAESGDLKVELSKIDSKMALNLTVDLYRHHEVAKGRMLAIDKEAESVVFTSDPSILSRVLGNMLKNALEATPPGGCVAATCRMDRGLVCFTVRNPGTIPTNLRSQIFKPNISTKGKGRGIGTYSMKLLTDSLHGSISFSTDQESGTTFRACYPLSFDETPTKD